jgi:DNA-binding CsgD family transcriptional regulator
LTNCEKTVLRLMIEGQSPRQMADQLCVSRRTVEYHLGHIYAKLDVNNRMEAIQQALRQGLFQPDDMVASSKRAPVMTKVAPAEHRQE